MSRQAAFSISGSLTESYVSRQLLLQGDFPARKYHGFPMMEWAELCKKADFSELPVKNDLVQLVL